MVACVPGPPHCERFRLATRALLFFPPPRRVCPAYHAPFCDERFLTIPPPQAPHVDAASFSWQTFPLLLTERAFFSFPSASAVRSFGLALSTGLLFSHSLTRRASALRTIGKVPPLSVSLFLFSFEPPGVRGRSCCFL